MEPDIELSLDLEDHWDNLHGNRHTTKTDKRVHFAAQTRFVCGKKTPPGRITSCRPGGDYRGNTLSVAAGAAIGKHGLILFPNLGGQIRLQRAVPMFLGNVEIGAEQA